MRIAAPLVPSTDAAQRQPAAGAVARQVVDSMRTALQPAAVPGTLEVALHPEDLGRVRLVFTPADAGLTISVQAERGETLEMLRRHIDLLERDLRDHGFANLSFDFAGGGDGQRDRDTPAAHAAPPRGNDTAGTRSGDAPGATPNPPPVPRRAEGAPGLDLRL
jgi:hypothetical protein